MDRSFENRKSDCIHKFIEDLIEFDGGFGELPFEVLVSFAKSTQEQLGTLPAPIDENWEEIVWLASIELIDDPED
ncbi:hypothetical protein NIES22_22350 [Calothrix brevissima NIES-22]|nr:hypothetical protein NIES22_22350 [Calothrix brevissima NIES-22]